MNKPGPHDPPPTLVDALLRAGASFAHSGITLFDGRGRRSERRGYGELLQAALRAGAELKAAGVRPGEPLLVCLSTSWEWWEGWMGALLLGALPVAVAPAGALGSSTAHTRRLAALKERLGGRVLASSAVKESAANLGEKGLLEGFLLPQKLRGKTSISLGAEKRDPEEVAFLQLTSGSTGLPRAVQISHRAALHNGRASSAAIGAPLGGPTDEWADGMVSWLPLHHDMGLVGCLFLCLSQGLDLWLLSPSTFLARPKLWLENLGRHGVCFAPAPNFGYQLCVERLQPENLKGMDLSHWRAAMTGAEMVRPETIAAFCELTRGTGFRPEAFRPCYGLAEATLAVTFDSEGRGLRTLPLPPGAENGLGLEEVACLGKPIADTQVQITAPDGSARPEGEIGEVIVNGPGVFTGYYQDPAATEECLRNGWLHTGDLGFLKNGELYLTGRTKDVLILRGHNVMPHELEWVAEGVTGGGGGLRSGAFSVAQGAEGEQAVLVVEVANRNPEGLSELAREIRLKMGRALNLPLADIAFVRRGKIPKTTSGKVQRRELRHQYLAGTLERLES